MFALSRNTLEMPRAPGRRSSHWQLRESLYAAAYVALAAEEWSRAQRCFSMMLAVSPFDHRAWYGIAAAREQAGDYRVAANLYEVAARFIPSSVHPKLSQARALRKLGDAVAAALVLDAAEAATEDTSALRLIAQERARS
jgi:tetratricopeptide (TPR) repeat protein